MANIKGWKDGKSVAIGTLLPKKDYVKYGIFRDDKDAKSLPPVIMGSDYPWPIPFITPIEVAVAMGVSREDSKAQEFLGELKAYGIGIGPSGMDVIEWADKLSQKWYGHPYKDLHKFGRPDLVGDIKKRNNIRAAMATKSWPAWIAMQSAQLQDTEHLSTIGGTTTEIIASTTGSLAAVLASACPICSLVLAIVATVFGIVNKVLLLASADTMEDLQRQIAASPSTLNMSDKAAACSIATLALDTNQAFLRAPGGVNVAVADASRAIINQLNERPETIPVLFSNCEAVKTAFPAAFPADEPEPETDPYAIPSWAKIDPFAGGLQSHSTTALPEADDGGEGEEKKSIVPWLLAGGAATATFLFLKRQ